MTKWVEEDPMKKSRDESFDECYECDFWKYGGCTNTSRDMLNCPVFNEDPMKKYDDKEQQVVGKDGGLKNDKDKPDWSLLPLDIIEGIVIILTYGAKKYERDNWKTVENRRNFAALLRHLTKWQKGEDIDEGSGLHHLDHALCDLMFIRWRTKNKKEIRL